MNFAPVKHIRTTWAHLSPSDLPHVRILTAYAIFGTSYLVFALGKFPGVKIDRPGAAIIGAVTIVAFRIAEPAFRFSGVLSAFFVNDILCLVMVPLILSICHRLGRKPIPYLLVVASASNIGMLGHFPVSDIAISSCILAP